jgi:integrase
MELDRFIRNVLEEKSLEATAEQLVCIIRLVYVYGIQRQEIPQLTVGDVLDQNGNVVNSISKFRKPLPLDDWAKAEIRAQLEELADREEPQMLVPSASLFPDYPNERKIHRHLKKAGLAFWNIRFEGMIKAARLMGSQWTEDHFRVSDITINANLRGRGMIPAGTKRHEDFEELKEQADLIARGSSMAEMPAEYIISRMESILKYTKYKKVRIYRSGVLEKTRKKLKRFLPPPPQSLPLPTPNVDDTDEDDD